MIKITTAGLDLAKNVFHLVCCYDRGKVVKKRKLKRREMLTFFATLESCLIGMESCASAHYWARQLEALGHEVKLIPAQYVKAYVRGNKNDYNDALAISEAVTRPQMSRWINKIRAARGMNKATVALAKNMQDGLYWRTTRLTSLPYRLEQRAAKR